MFVVCGMDRGLVLMRSSDEYFTYSSVLEYFYVVLDYSLAKMIFLIELL